MKRRDFLKSLLVLPLALVPRQSNAAAPVHRLMRGDHVDYCGPIPSDRSFIGGRLVAWSTDDGRTVFVDNGAYGKWRAVERYDRDHVKLFEGLPGNRVDNPSMRHRLTRDRGTIGLRYPEDPRNRPWA